MTLNYDNNIMDKHLYTPPHLEIISIKPEQVLAASNYFDSFYEDNSDFEYE